MRVNEIAAPRRTGFHEASALYEGAANSKSLFQHGLSLLAPVRPRGSPIGVSKIDAVFVI